MAAVTCQDCGGTVSTTAGKCPHCGRIMKQFDVGRALVLALFVIVVLWVIIAIIGYFRQPEPY